MHVFADLRDGVALLNRGVVATTQRRVVVAIRLMRVVERVHLREEALDLVSFLVGQLPTNRCNPCEAQASHGAPAGAQTPERLRNTAGA